MYIRFYACGYFRSRDLETTRNHNRRRARSTPSTPHANLGCASPYIGVSHSASMRIATLFAMTLIAAEFGAHTFGQLPAPPKGPTYEINGTIVYSGLDALPWHTKVHAYLKATTDGGADVVAEQTILTEGEQIPIKFSLSIPRNELHPKDTYSICADIYILERLRFECWKPMSFRGIHPPKQLDLTLRRVQ